MTKTIGSKDKVLHRKKRSDFGRKRNKYRGEPCKHHKRKRYHRRIGEKDSIIIWVQQKKNMTRDGYLNWKSHLRPKLYKETTDWKSTKPIRVKTNDINTKSKLEGYIAKTYWCGKDGKPQKFIVMGVSHGKTKTHFKWVKICTIIIKGTPEGNVGSIIDNKRLSKYGWFYKN
ncbi:MAG: hypothetical protein KKF48_02705 [Nanoarchaeota archaeon]|nr:hypothetical protein [Nanoarchaeota archaeon]MBU1027932.1 hypothetical protein [Nanoarchaeota archaeon]